MERIFFLATLNFDYQRT